MDWNPQPPEPEIRDHTGLFNAPNSLDCARWSEDNLLAIAAGASITILNPATLGITRAFAPYRSVDLSVWAPGFRPREWVDSPQFALAAVTEVNVQASAGKQGWRCVSWSPAGCTPPGGCYLAALSTDHTVRHFPPHAQLRAPGPHLVDVSGQTHNRMHTPGMHKGARGVLRCTWRPACLAPLAGPAAGPARGRHEQRVGRGAGRERTDEEHHGGDRMEGTWQGAEAAWSKEGGRRKAVLQWVGASEGGNGHAES